MLLLATGVIRVFVVMLATWFISKGAFTQDQFSAYENEIVNAVAFAVVAAATIIWHQLEANYAKAKHLQQGADSVVSAVEASKNAGVSFASPQLKPTFDAAGNVTIPPSQGTTYK